MCLNDNIVLHIIKMDTKTKVPDEEYHVKLSDDDDLPKKKDKLAKGKPMPEESKGKKDAK